MERKHTDQELIGEKYNRWTVLKRALWNKQGQIMWLCLCECGTKRAIQTYQLTSGKSKSCGCRRAELAAERKPHQGHIKDLMGQKFGKLTVIQFHSMTSTHNAIYLCECSCGIKKAIRSRHLISGATRSCGCLRTGKKKKQF